MPAVIEIFDWHGPYVGVKAGEAGGAHGKHRLPLDRRPRHRSQGRLGQDWAHNASVHQRRREDRAQPESGGSLEAHRMGPDTEGRQGGADLELIGDGDLLAKGVRMEAALLLRATEEVSNIARTNEGYFSTKHSCICL